MKSSTTDADSVNVEFIALTSMVLFYNLEKYRSTKCYRPLVKLADVLKHWVRLVKHVFHVFAFQIFNKNCCLDTQMKIVWKRKYESK